jgi:hypothetical protein
VKADKEFATLQPRVIEPDLKEFIDTVLVPMLVRDAVRELKPEINLACARESVGESARSQDKP